MDTTNPFTEVISSDPMTPSALERVERAAIDVQISTAKRFPRSLELAKRRMMDMVCLDQATAQSCFYTLRRKEAGGQVKLIQGMSVRLAEIASVCYGNLHAVSREVENDGRFITAQAVAHDLENNVRIGIEVKRRITNKQGQTFSDDMQVVTGNAACSIALRNAVFRVVPVALMKPVYEAAKACAVGDQKTLGDRRRKAIETFEKLGVTRARIFHTLGVQGEQDITLQHLEILIGMHTAIKDGEQTLEEAFPQPNEETPPAPTVPPEAAATEVNKPAASTAATTAAETPQMQLAALIISYGGNYDTFAAWAEASGHCSNALALPGFEALPTDVCKRLLRAKKGLAAQFGALKGTGDTLPM